MRVEKGSITVFLTFVLILVLALAGTMIEAARVKTGQGMEKRSLNTAVKAVFTEYYRPLYEDYHLFFLDKGVKEDSGETFLSAVKEYMEASLEWKKEGTIISEQMTDLYSVSQSKLTASEMEYAVDEKGEIFLQEATAYMKYKCTASFVEELLEQIGILKKTEKTAQITEEKMKLEESMGELDYQILEIIQNTEGLSYGRNGLKLLGDNRLQTETVFSKIFSPKGINKGALAISNELVWNSLKEQYQNPDVMLCSMERAVGKIQEQTEKIKELEQKREDIEEAFSEIEEPKKGEIRTFEENIERIEKRIERIREQMEEPRKQMEEGKDQLIKEAVQIQNKMRETIPLILELEKKQKELCGELSEYKGKLETSEGEMASEAYQGFLKDYEEKKKYVDKQGNQNQNLSFVSRIVSMKPILQNNIKILDSFETLDKNFDLEEKEELLLYKKQLGFVRSQLQEYDVKSLSFDYSSLSVKKQMNPLSGLKELLEHGIFSLVLEDASAVSDKMLKEAGGLYETYGEKNSQRTERGQEIQNSYGERIGNMEKDGYQSEIGEGFGSLGTAVEGIDLKKGADKLLLSILLNEYMMSHFKNARMDTGISGKREKTKTFGSEEEVLGKKSRLSYEMEYILGGKESDEENLHSIINKILFVRTIFNFISIMTDSDKKETAYAAAAALVGITGLEALVRLTQTLILLAWSYEEAIVDTAFLFAGYSVPVIKQGKNFHMSFPELFCLSRGLILEKIQKEGKAGERAAAEKFQSLYYEGWIRLFLLLEAKEKRCYRSMDLINENMGLRNNPLFSMENMLFGICVKAEYQIPSKFMELPFVSSISRKKKGEWGFEEIMAYSY